MFTYTEIEKAATLAVGIKGRNYRYHNHLNDDAGYTDCVNGRESEFGDTVPACIVGFIIFILTGELPDDLGASVEGTCYVGDTAEALPVTKKAFVALKYMQTWQDAGGTWGDALTQAALHVDEFNEDGQKHEFLVEAAPNRDFVRDFEAKRNSVNEIQASLATNPWESWADPEPPF